MKILAIKLADLGDALTVTPALRALRETYPAAEIDVVTTGAGAAVFTRFHDVDRLIEFDKYQYDRPGRSIRFRALEQIGALTRTLRARRYDRVLLFHHLSTMFGALKFAGLIQVAGGRSAGLDNGRGWFLDDRLPDGGFGAKHEVEYWLELAGLVGAKTTNHRLHWPLDRAASTIAAGLLTTNGRPTIALYPGSGGYSLARRWPADRWVALGRQLQNSGFHLVLVGTERDLTGQIAAGIGADVFDLGGRTTLNELAEVLRRCQLLIGNDGGVSHLAAAVGTPVVAIFGPTNDRAWAPWDSGGAVEVVAEPLPCRPCLYRGRTLGDRDGCPERTCLQLISPARVIQAAERLLPVSARSPVPGE